VRAVEEARAAAGGARPTPLRVCYDDPCHLIHGQRVADAPRTLLRAIPGLELVSHDDPGSCCGAAGIYNLTHREMSAAVLERNLTYHHGLAALERIDLRFYDTPAALARALERREVDGALLERVPATDVLGAVLARSDLRVTPMVEAAYSILYLNNQRAPLTVHLSAPRQAGCLLSVGCESDLRRVLSPNSPTGCSPRARTSRIWAPRPAGRPRSRPPASRL